MSRLTLTAVLKLIAWSLLLFVTVLTLWREPAMLFLDDFFEMSVSSQFGLLPPEERSIDLRHLADMPKWQNTASEDIVAAVSEADRAALLQRPLAEPSVWEIPRQISGMTAGLEYAETKSSYASQYTPQSSHGAALLPDEIPTLAQMTATNPGFAAEHRDEELPKNLSTALPTIRDRSKLDAIAPMVSLSGGTFRMGSDTVPEQDQRPAHVVRLKPFRLDCHEVTNRQFLMFVQETQYQTTAEQNGWSHVFDPKEKAWIRLAGACWWNVTGQTPFASPHAGSEEALRNTALTPDFPVVHVSWDDAVAFCHWAGKRLPSEAEWEFAAKAGLQNPKYPWGDYRQVNGKQMANYWQGWFPDNNTAADGFAFLAPVKSFPANRYGLFDLGGNAWEWVGDRYLADYYRRSALDNPLGPTPEEGAVVSVLMPSVPTTTVSTYHAAEVRMPLRVVRGGAFLSAENSDAGYRTTARGSQPQTLSFQDVGFRCAE